MLEVHGTSPTTRRLEPEDATTRPNLQQALALRSKLWQRAHRLKSIEPPPPAKSRRRRSGRRRASAVTITRPNGTVEILPPYTPRQLASIDRRAARQPRTWDEINSAHGGGTSDTFVRKQR
jgi:hypothetical protein